jgi:hypothetical protein
MDFLARLGGKKVDPIEEAKKVRVLVYAHLLKP